MDRIDIAWETAEKFVANPKYVHIAPLEKQSTVISSLKNLEMEKECSPDFPTQRDFFLFELIASVNYCY